MSDLYKVFHNENTKCYQIIFGDYIHSAYCYDRTRFLGTSRTQDEAREAAIEDVENLNSDLQGQLS